MKKITSFSNFILFAAAGALLAGCGTVGGLFTATPQVVPAQTNVIAAIQPATTNNQGIVSPPTTNSVVAVTPATTNTVYAVSPTVQAVLQTGQAMAPLAPAPFNGLAEGGLALLSGVLGIIAAWKNKQLNAAQKIAAIVQPVVAGVEAAANPAVKAAIQSHAVAAGVQQVLDPIVQSVSQQMPAATPPAPSTAPITQPGANAPS
jgi:hypothetical protein